MGSVEDRERLKEEYKQHYRAINEARKKAAESERLAKIASTLDDMNAGHLIEKFDSMLHKVREKIEIAEAKMDILMENRRDEDLNAEFEEMEQKRKASESLHKIRAEMGILQSDVDNHVEQIKGSDKTLGPKAGAEEKKQSKESDVHKTLGPRITSDKE